MSIPTLRIRPAVFATLAFVLGLAGAVSGCEEKAKTISGVTRLSPELQKTLKPSAVLFIVARRAGEEGPPLAVKRFAQPLVFPMEFTISGQDAMIPNTPFEGEITLTARIAQSGSATPISEGDIEGAPAPKSVPVGSKDVQIDLNQQVQKSR